MAETNARPNLWLVRHGETEWARLLRHTGRTDVPLTPRGRAQAAAVAAKLAGTTFGLVVSSPLSRALDTGRLAGFTDRVTTDDDLLEWDYGDLEGRTTAEIREGLPDWTIWRGPVPGGEAAEDVATRVDRFIARVRTDETSDGAVLAFAHGHVLRVLTARWLGRPPTDGGMFALSTATVSVLGWEHGAPVVVRWNEACG
ncbi:MAG: histidine phosphatase family protein [Chloroflexota bacterium]